MREMKFRAWSTLLKEMLNPGSKEEIEEYPEYGLTVSFDGRIYEKDNEGTSCLMDNLKLMQFTGLKDKNGKEIYEGDIVEFEEQLHKEVYTAITDYGFHYHPFIIGGTHLPKDCEVIGNKFENPELLK